MDPKVNYFIVGLFVVILSVSVIFFALWMTFGLNKTVYNHYWVYTSESVSGLSIEAPVKFNGVNVGSVTAISLTPNNPEQVTVEIAVEAGTPVSVDTRALMMSQGITGLTYINLQGGNAHSLPLKCLPGQAFPVIQSSPSLMVRIDATIQNLSESIKDIDKSVSQLLCQENQKNIRDILQSVARLTHAMADHHVALGDSVDMLPLLVKNLSDATASAAQTYSTLNGQLSQGLLMNINNMMVELQANPSMLIRGRASVPPGPGE